MRARVARPPPPPRLRLLSLIILTLLVPSYLSIPVHGPQEIENKEDSIIGNEFLHQEQKIETTSLETDPITTDIQTEALSTQTPLETTAVTTPEVNVSFQQAVTDPPNEVNTPVKVEEQPPPNPPPVVQVSVSVSSSVSEVTPRPYIFSTFLTAFAETAAPQSTLSPLPAAASRSQLSIDEPVPSTVRQYGARTYSNRYRPRTIISRTRPRLFAASQSASEPIAVRLAPSSAFNAAARLTRFRPTYQPTELPKQPEARSINYHLPEQRYQQHSKIFTQPAKSYSQPEKVYAEPEKVYGEPEKVYGEPEKVYAEPEKVYAEPEKVYGEPEKAYTPPVQTYAQPEQNYAQPEQNYEIPESVSVETNGRAHGVQPSPATTSQPEGLQVFDKALDSGRVAASQKFAYVAEERNYRKYRVEERTPDGFIVGEYGVVSHDDGQLRGVRYTADSTINPKLIYDALMKFLAL